MSKEIREMLDDAEQLEVTEDGEIVPRSQGQKPKGQGVNSRTTLSISRSG